MKTGHESLGTVEEESGRTKHENGTRTPSLPSKMSQGAQIMKTEPDALGTVENDSGSAKH
jgi:hypothetical protein